MILLFFMRSGALFPAKPPAEVADLDEWAKGLLEGASWYCGHNAKTDDFLMLRVADIIAIQITDAARLDRGLISIPGSGRMN